WDVRDEFLHLPGDGLMLVNSAGLISFFDNRARELMGRHGRGEPLCQHWPELANCLEQLAIGTRDSGPLVAIVPCAGVPRHVRLFRSDDGVGVVLVNDRQGLSPYINEQLLMHKRILRHIRDAVIVTTSQPIGSPGPVIVYANPAALAQTGYRLEEILGHSPRIFQGPNTDPAAIGTFHEALEHWQAVRQTVLNYRQGGSSFWVEIDITPLADSDGWYS
ncbi:MAG: PAS domain-containing protein, partial [Vulcanococcus sp.]